jgi:hypothetical protein
LSVISSVNTITTLGGVPADEPAFQQPEESAADAVSPPVRARKSRRDNIDDFSMSRFPELYVTISS